MAAGHGGQILVADSTAGLLSGVDLMDLGPRRLRDVPTPIGVFQVRSEGLGTQFSRLRALDTTPGNLRPAATSFVGRESDITDIEAAMRSHRLVTLTGVGGVGKTRLALEVAARFRHFGSATRYQRFPREHAGVAWSWSEVLTMRFMDVRLHFRHSAACTVASKTSCPPSIGGGYRPAPTRDAPDPAPPRSPGP